MPTYKYSPSETSVRRMINIDGKVYYPEDKIESKIYYSNSFMNNFELVFVSDEPFISPLIVSTGKVSGDSELIIPDSNWGFNMYAQIPSGMELLITFNNDTDPSNTIFVTTSGTIARNISGRAFNKLSIKVEKGSGNYCIYCMRVEQSRYPDSYGL